MSAADAKQIAWQTKFQPVGRRPLDGGNMDGAFCAVPLKQYLEHANRDLVLHRGPRQDAHALAIHHRLLHRVDVVELEDNINLDAVMPLLLRVTLKPALPSLLMKWLSIPRLPPGSFLMTVASRNRLRCR